VNRAPGVISGEFAGRYTIERELGRGATSVVYLAHESAGGRAVAIKLLRAELLTVLSTERFLREIRVTSKLEHPNIVPVLDSGEVDGRPFCVLPHMEGGTLRDRLQRTKQLPIADAITIGIALARALHYAHERDMLHRDVKPENILFDREGRACLSDFGIARALNQATGESTTSTGVVRGTPAYMSPEQAAGDRDLDGRSDIYSLACTLYEALAGVPAFVGPTSQSVVAQRLTHVPRGVRMYRPTVPPQLEAVLDRALALSPADRFNTAGEFATALSNALTAPSGGAVRLPPSRTRMLDGSTRAWGAIAAVPLVALVVTGVMLATQGSDGGLRRRVNGFLANVGITRADLDTAVYAMVVADSASRSFAVAEPLRSRLRRWDEVRLVDGIAVDVAERKVRNQPIAERARRVAVDVGAGRYVVVRAERSGDSLDVSAALFDTQTGTRLVEKAVRVGTNAVRATPAIDTLANALLIRDRGPHVARSEGREGRGTTSLQARQVFLRGQVALEDGDFVRADSAFSVAARLDANYAQALVWLANLRSWMGNWRQHSWSQLTRQAAQAEARRRGLSLSDSVLLNALVALDAGRRDQACRGWSRLTEIDPFDFAAWYGLGTCLARDSIVMRDSNAPSQWRFRASYERAIRAYEQAFRLRPSILFAFGGRSLSDLQDLFFTASSHTRIGLAMAPDTFEFRAFPVWRGDSLSFVPMRKETALQTLPDGAVLAVQRQRERFQNIVEMWRTEVPRSAEAAEAVAVSLEMLGNAAALDTLRLARGLAGDPANRLRIAANEVLLRVKFSLPSNLNGLNAARALMDSLFATYPPPSREPLLLASLAGLAGRADLAASYAVAASAGENVPPAIAQSGPALLAYAALGGPADSLRSLEEAVEIGRQSLPESNRNTVMARWLRRAAALAFPEHRLRTLSDVGRSPSPNAQVDLLTALASTDPTAIRRVLSRFADLRRNVRPSEIRMESLFVEAAALASIGDTRQAIEWLDPTLRSIRLSTSTNFSNVVQTGPLVRAMVLRARLAERVGDPAAARTWAKAVVALWSGADSFLRPTVRDMERLAR
jgi:serine/threonine-protein kinase